jgi:hypothetical protein
LAVDFRASKCQKRVSQGGAFRNSAVFPEGIPNWVGQNGQINFWLMN